MGFLSNSKVVAEIAEISSRIYGTIIDKGKTMAEKDAKIKALEKELEELKKKVGQ